MYKALLVPSFYIVKGTITGGSISYILELLLSNSLKSAKIYCETIVPNSDVTFGAAVFGSILTW